jgi:phosphoglucomutase
MPSSFAPVRAKMEAEGIATSAISAFESTFNSFASGNTGMIPESTISPSPDLVNTDSLDITPDTELLKETVVLKLNGGLGTGMGLDKAKSLLKVKGNDTFLDLTAKQVMKMRKDYGFNVKFMLMNSFSTSEDTLDFFAENYPTLRGEKGLEMIQNKVPKLDATTYEPATCETDPSNEWCPPGHGDLYAALVGSGCLDSLIADGYKYMFVSNSDNLGATLCLKILSYFAKEDAPFMMECCARTENDKKGGHLAVRKSDSQLILRESAMCADEDEADFQDITKHKFFNTNNLWIRLDKLKETIDKFGGFIPLPMIMNNKTVDPKNDASQKVVQLETAMGAAIECFQGAAAVCVPRTRFAPVKKCNDLLLLRSDAYTINSDFIPELNPACGGKAPVISLDSKKYKLVGKLEEAIAGGIPSLVNCDRLTVKGLVRMSKKTTFVGDVSIKNDSSESKLIPTGEVKDATLDLTDATGLGPLKAAIVKTSPIDGQKPGTSGLRKKTKVFMEENYLNNFVQATFDAIKASGTDVSEGSLVIGGDGRYYNDTAIQTIIKMGIANGVTRFWVGKDGLLSTPAVSAVIRERTPVWQKAFGAFILTASHNPGGPEEDFGIKYNCENGGPAPEKLTNAIYANTTTIKEYKICNDFPTIDISTVGNTTVEGSDGSCEVNVDVISATEEQVALLKTIFDFGAIKSLLDRPDFTMVYDSMHGVNGPYAKAVFVDELGQDESTCLNAVPKDDFNGGHADPNLTYAKELVAKMGLDKKGNKIAVEGAIPSFGAAADGDADRNMILGTQFFVTPSDSLAIIAAYADVIPFFKSQGGLKGVARSMPTSGAVDLVAKDLNFELFETPTGWKYFGNLMDSKDLFGGKDYTPFICGEESFGTGSNHIREKDGIWAVLAWLSILASENTDATKPLVTVEDIVTKHWGKYGRNYYCRWDFEGMDKVGATAMMDKMRSKSAANTGKTVGSYTIATADDFTYVDPVDGSVAKKQGVRFLMADGSRIIFRLSGTAGSGATVRMYIEQYEPSKDKLGMVVSDALKELVEVALGLCDIKTFCGTDIPTVIT